ncbi:uncharacterized protein [Nicotiana tomentosiformis]|uniref:uncharacterized protein n=1 Tax=Nicotiana tomentosiformis TaxID=4098 RepID=UPI00388CD040
MVEEGQSTYRPPRLNGQYYGWWKTKMHDFIMTEDSKLWDIICDGPFIPTKNLGDPAIAISKMRKEFNDADRKAVEKNFRAKKILVCGIGPDEYNRISELTIDELVGNLKTYEMKNKKDNERREPKREKNPVLKTDSNDSSGEDGDMAYLTRRFEKMRNSYSESEEENDHGDSSMMEVESEATEYDSIFALMAQFDDDEDDDNDEVNFLDVQRNLKSYSPKKLMSLANVLIDTYHSLINDKDALTVELGEAKQTRDDLVVIVVDLKETIENLKKEKDALDEKIANTEHERDDLMVIVVDLKETFDCVRKEKEVLAERVANIEHERNDLLVVVVDLKETIGELKMESRPENSQKGKEVTSEVHIKLESELNSMKSSLCAELEKNKQLQEELGRVKSDLEKSLSSGPGLLMLSLPCTPIKGETCRGLGSKGKIFPTTLIASTLLYLTIGFELTAETVKGSSLQWYMDSGCSKHMNGSRSTNDFLSLKALQRGSRFFGNGKKGYILGVERIGKSLSHSIKNVYYVNGLKYSLLSVSQICDKGNKVEFVRLGHASFTLLNKLVRKDLVLGLPKSSFKDHKVCDAYVKGKQVRSSFKPKREVSTLRPLDLFHMDLCGPMRVARRGGKKYIFVIVDDYSRFTWTMFLITKDETFEVFVAFVKKIQVKMGNNIACIRFDHGTEFDNAKFDEFYTENGITHNFSAPRTPQQNGVVERKNRTLEYMARTMLFDSGIAKNFWGSPS